MQSKVLAQSSDADGATRVTLEICEDGGVQVFYHDVGAAAERLHGDADYEAWLKVPPAHLARLAFALLADKLDGKKDALTQLRAFCDAHGVGFENGVWS